MRRIVVVAFIMAFMFLGVTPNSAKAEVSLEKMQELSYREVGIFQSANGMTYEIIYSGYSDDNKACTISIQRIDPKGKKKYGSRTAKSSLGEMVKSGGVESGISLVCFHLEQNGYPILSTSTFSGFDIGKISGGLSKVREVGVISSVSKDEGTPVDELPRFVVVLGEDWTHQAFTSLYKTYADRGLKKSGKKPGQKKGSSVVPVLD